jgi:hypothetical protein
VRKCVLPLDALHVRETIIRDITKIRHLTESASTPSCEQAGTALQEFDSRHRGGFDTRPSQSACKNVATKQP